MQNRAQIRDFVRYQLSQLGARNSAHEFEKICFELARRRYVSNLLPATGPVQAGGDQGRDFETYRTSLRDAGLGSSSFLSLVSDELVVGACTLQSRDIAAKIRKDLKSMFATGERPARVIYFCEQNIPVASRHKLQGHCSGTYDAVLNIIDGEAIADQLSDPDTFWIASQYLNTPADIYPQDDSDEAYVDLRRCWIVDRTTPENHADFLEIREGMRAATAEEALRPDLTAWLEIMRAYLDAAPTQRFRQKARYEIAVAELQGRGDLDPAGPLIEAYFTGLELEEPLAPDVLDAATLATFCWCAIGYGKSRLDRGKVRKWAEQVRAISERLTEEVGGRGDRCTLLESQAVLTGVPLEGISLEAAQDAVLDAWLRFTDAAEETRFYPIERLSLFVELTAPLLAGRPAYARLRDRVDELTRDRSGGHAVAAQSERRGLAYYETGRLRLAIDELQRAKVGWFSGERLGACVQTMTVLSNIYSDLGLTLAARYYAAGATYLALHSGDDDVRALMPGAAFQLVRMTQAGGETLSAISMMRQALAMHWTLEKRPYDIENHPMFTAAFTELAIGYAIVRRLAPQVSALADEAMGDWGFSVESLKTFRSGATNPKSPWVVLSEDEVLQRLEDELGRSPLEDVGPVRTHTWPALGVDWTLRYENEPDTAAAALGLGAVLQVLQVEMSLNDLLVIPDSVIIEVRLGAVEAFDVDDDPDSDATWEITLPPATAAEDLNGESEFRDYFTLAATLLGQVTAMGRDDYMNLVADAMKREVWLRAYSVRPAREMMAFAAAQITIHNALAATPAPRLKRPIAPRRHDELAWPTTPAACYSVEKASELNGNRYANAWESARPSLTRALSNPRVKALALDMKADGLRDWQILGCFWNILCQAQVDAQGTPRSLLMTAFLERSRRPEQTDDPQVDLSVIEPRRLEAQRYSSDVMSLRAWGLSLHRRWVTPQALRRFLDVRFRQAVDDVPHEDLFGGPEMRP